MLEKIIKITTADGEMPVFTVFDEAWTQRPLVIMLMDALGVREELREAARRIAAQGYQPLLPDLYYRHGQLCELDMSNPNDFQRMLKYYKTLSHGEVVADCGYLLSWASLEMSSSSDAVGVVGYCMGGSFALSVANAWPDRVAAVASVHPGHLVTEREDSPHRNLAAMRATLYFAIADGDEYAPLEHLDILRNALDSHGLIYEMEVLDGALHGFTFPSLPSYQREASEHQWRKVLALFDSTLR